MTCSSTKYGDFDENSVEAVLKAWEILAPPIRPSEDVISAYRKYFAVAADQPILIFGATPELIDLALEVNASEIVSIDWNADNFEAMRRLSRRDWNRVVFYHGGWTESIDELEGRFACVASDAGPIFLTFPQQWSELTQVAHSYLNEGGNWISRSWQRSDQSNKLDLFLQQHMADFEEARAGLDQNEELEAFKQLTMHFRLRILKAAADESGIIDQKAYGQYTDHAMLTLCDHYQEPHFREIIEMNMVQLCRPEPDSADVISLADLKIASQLAEKIGFNTTIEKIASGMPNSGYLFAATKR